MAAVVHVIPVVDVVHVNVVGVVPGARPVFRPRINDAEPEASVLESRVSAHDDDWVAANSEPVSTAKIRVEAIFRNAVAPVASAFMPTMMLVLPVFCAMVLPDIGPSGMFLVVVPLWLAHGF